jgi:hypothetical protein
MKKPSPLLRYDVYIKAKKRRIKRTIKINKHEYENE